MPRVNATAWLAKSLTAPPESGHLGDKHITAVQPCRSVGSTCLQHLVETLPGSLPREVGVYCTADIPQGRTRPTNIKAARAGGHAGW